VPDPRLPQIAKVAHVPQQIPATIEFVDIAGLVKGASRGEGLGNKFLSHIREVDALVHVVRCFEDPDIVHVTGAADPVRDIDIVLTELILSDLETIHRRQEKIGRDVKRGDKHALVEGHLLERFATHLNTGKPANTLAAAFAPDEKAAIKTFGLLTDKPTVIVANVKEADLLDADKNPMVSSIRQYAATHHGCDTVVLSVQLESDLADLSAEEAKEYLSGVGRTSSGLDVLLEATYKLLALRTFFTFNDKEVRAWTIHAGDTACRAAGTIHTDFERGFIKAETINWADLVKEGSIAHARETGRYRIEGRDYVVRDGDVLLIRFSI
jgi:GTP-binding protein YchF